MKKLILLAEAGDADAQARMVEYCIINRDIENAWKWASLSASQGNPMGLYALGMCYTYGYNVKKDIDKARILFNESYEKGCHRALVGLATLFAEEGRPFCREAVSLICEAASANDAKAQYLLALLYKDGVKVVRSLKRYISLLVKSAAQNYLPAMYTLAQEYLLENTPFFDSNKGMELLKEAAQQGFPKAEAHLAYLTLEGKGIEKDKVKAFKMFQHAAKKDCPEAIRSLGFCYLQGQGVEKDWETAGECFKQAASLGLTDCEAWAEIALGGKGRLKEMIIGDPSTKAEFDLRDKIETEAKAGNPEALYRLGYFYINGKVDQWMSYEKNFDKARECFSEAAKSGHLKSAFALGCLLQNGYDDHAPNLEAAIQWYEFAATQGHLESMAHLAFCYQNTGHSEIAVRWLEKASSAGDTLAQGMLSSHYLFGIGTDENPSKAFELAVKSAEAGEVEGQKSLGLCYLYGEGTEQNIEVAIEYLTKAANQDNEVAMLILGRLLMGDYGYKNIDYEVAEELLSKAANMDNGSAAYYLGILYNDFLKEPQLAFSAFIRSAQLGNPEAKEIILQYIKQIRPN